MLSSSSLQVMVAMSSVSCAERSPTCPERKRNPGRPTPKYTKVGERLRHVIPGHVACSVACGGKACKYENPARWSEQEQAIKGVYSSWVTDHILAMARPSTELLEKYCIIEQFRSHGIKTIINLQRPGEHASCGNPLEQESGFTYLPEAFMEAGMFCVTHEATQAEQGVMCPGSQRSVMAAGSEPWTHSCFELLPGSAPVYFYNFGWKDYGVASLTTILDMVKVMTFALQEGKVAVHCHAGLGRTGVLIACYLVFATRMTADQAIIFVRAKRPNSIQTRGQLLCVREFTQFLVPLRNVFSCCDPKAHAVTLAQLLLDLAENRPVVRQEVAAVPGLSAEIEKTVSEVVTRQLEKALLRHDSYASGSFAPSAVVADCENQDAVLSSEQEFDPLWKRRNIECLQPLTHLKRRLSYSDSDLKRAESVLERGGTPWTAPAQGLLCHKPISRSQLSVGLETQDGRDLSKVTPSTVLQSELSVEARRIVAAKALANLDEFAEEEEVKRKVEMWQKELNSRDGAWERLCGERDPLTLCSLMWSWVEQLKEPVIPRRDVDTLLDRRAEAAEALFLLDKGQHQTILCVLHCVASLRAIPADVEEAILARAIKAFTKVSFDSENGPVVYNTLKKIFKHTLEEKRKMTKDDPKPDVW
ncbi:protein tyrosine phosphatase domain containing 1 isoform 1 [Camelus ferus]|nr:protein tyrosine phosphatase domain containing 1 isoform 1 [Camelus ferus]